MKTTAFIRFFTLLLLIGSGGFLNAQYSTWISSQTSWLNNSYPNTIENPLYLLDNNAATNGYLSMSYWSTLYTKEIYLDFGSIKTIDGFKFAYEFPNTLKGACSFYPGNIVNTCKGNLYYKNQDNQWINAYTCPYLNTLDSSMVCPMNDSTTFTFCSITAREWKFEMVGNYWLGGGFQTTTYYRVHDIYFREAGPSSPQQATDITFSNIQSNQFTFNWTNGNGSNRVVFIKQDNTGTPIPLNNTTYTANTSFGAGSQIGTTGWYCVFNGTSHASGVTVTNLLQGNTYRVMVCEYTGSPGSEQYNTCEANNNPRNQMPCAKDIPTDGLVAWYPFNGNANDESGNGHNGVVNGATLTTDRFGNTDRAYSFDGQLNKISSNIGNQQSISISLWYNSSFPIQWYPSLAYLGTTIPQTIEFMGQLGNHPYYQGHEGEIKMFGGGIVSTYIPTFNQWHHLVGIFEAGTDSTFLYIDGLLNKTGHENSAGLTITDGSIFFGNTLTGQLPDGGAGFLGSIDDIFIYNRALSDCEITALYEEEQSFSCGDPVTYESQTYNTVQIGTQCWFKENLNVGTRIDGSEQQTNNGIKEKYCYYNNVSNCDSYGGLYQWNETMQYATTERVQGLCPTGWHIPSNDEWCTLTTYIDPSVDCDSVEWIGTDVGTKMKSTDGWVSGGNGTDEYGFTARPGGGQNSLGFWDLHIYAHFWSSSELTVSNAWLWSLISVNTTIRRQNTIKPDASSIRCLKDSNEGPTTQATNITFSNITSNQFTFNWTDGNGTSRAAFIKEGSDGTASPVNNTTYTANTAFGSGSQIGTTGWYCIFNGTTHPDGITVTNLSPCKTYRIMVCEYTGSPGSEIYNTSTAFKNPENVQTSGSVVIPTDGLVAWYPFNGNANDMSGNGNNGTVNGASLTTDRFGVADKAYYFNGSSKIVIADNLSLNFPTGGYSISVWAKRTSTQMVGHILGKRNQGGNFQYQVGYADAPWGDPGIGFGGISYTLGLNSLIASGYMFPVNLWWNIIGTFDGNVYRVFVNGALIDSLIAVRIPSEAVPLTIGTSGNFASQSFIGSLDDIRIYNRALTESEISDLYHEGEQQPIVVTSPNGGERWKVGDTHPITWTSCGVDNVKIEYSINNGTNWTTIINDTPASAGSYAWSVPDTPSELCLVKITNTSDGTIFDQSDAVFTIYKETIPQIIVTSPNGSERWKVGDIHPITWISSGVDNIKIEYSINSGTNWTTIINETIASSGSYAWTVPNTPSDLCLAKITSTTDAAVFDVSDITFVIYAPESVSIIIPNAFTPNGDGYNDTFGPVTRGIGSLEMNINDRNGRFVHKIDSVNGRWDGNMPSGSAAPQGVYFYLLKAMGFDNLEYVRQGNVNLYRDLIDLTPNPVKSTAVLDLSGRFSGDKTISIYSSTGILLRKFTAMEDVIHLNLSFLNAGLYILKAADPEQVIVVKFIKE